jgi:oxalate decarboxylase
MRLHAGGVRELHWHKAAKRAYMRSGAARIMAVEANGRNFVDDVGEGDLWYFPGTPRSIQGLNPDGAEFQLVFDDGDVEEDNTFLLSDWIKHTPSEILARTSAFRLRYSPTVQIPANLAFFRHRCQDRSTPIRSQVQPRCRKASVIE